MSDPTPPPHRWSAGRVAECDSSSRQSNMHRAVGIHVIVRCVCGAAFQSTDAGIALGMAQAHEKEGGSHHE